MCWTWTHAEFYAEIEYVIESHIYFIIFFSNLDLKESRLSLNCTSIQPPWVSTQSQPGTVLFGVDPSFLRTIRLWIWTKSESRSTFLSFSWSFLLFFFCFSFLIMKQSKTKKLANKGMSKLLLGVEKWDAQLLGHWTSRGEERRGVGSF